MRAWISTTVCRLIGHQWGWPDILTCIQPEGLRFLPQWRECQRCGLREQDEKHEARILILPSFQGDPRDCAFDNFGHKVKRAMGWDR